MGQGQGEEEEEGRVRRRPRRGGHRAGVRGDPAAHRHVSPAASTPVVLRVHLVSAIIFFLVDCDDMKLVLE